MAYPGTSVMLVQFNIWSNSTIDRSVEDMCMIYTDNPMIILL